MAERNLTFRDLTQGINSESLKIPNPLRVPDNQFHELLDKVIERSTLEEMSERESFYYNEEKAIPEITWLKITRLPVSPDNVGGYNLFDRWQGVLSSMHEWGYRFYFLLQRKDGKTGIYLGVRSQNEYFNANDAIEQVEEATSGSMPGIELKKLSDVERYNLVMSFDAFSSIGAVTGLPSFFSGDRPGVLQTLDPLAFGIRGKGGVERDYNLLMIGDPISDADTTDIMNRMRTLGSEIHTYVQRTTAETETRTETKDKALGAAGGSAVGSGVSMTGGAVSSLLSGGSILMPILGPILGLAFCAAGAVMGSTGKSISETHGTSASMSSQRTKRTSTPSTECCAPSIRAGRPMWSLSAFTCSSRSRTRSRSSRTILTLSRSSTTRRRE